MDRIEQAILTSAATDGASGCHVVASSPGVRPTDLRELAAWGPPHGALLESAGQDASLIFHPLPSGAHGISRSVPAGRHDGGGGGPRVCTHCLVVPPRVLAQFANNPLALWRAAAANGSVPAIQEIPRPLEALRLPGRAAAVDTALLARLCASPGPDWMAALLQAALDSVTLAIVGGPPAEHVVEGLIQCLPPACRTEFSFSTGQAFSSRRPLRIVVFPADSGERWRVERLYNVTTLAISGAPPAEFTHLDAWPRLIHRALRSGDLPFLASRLGRPSKGVSLADLPAFGLQMLEELDAPAGGQIFLSASADAEPWSSASVVPDGDAAAGTEAGSPADVLSSSPRGDPSTVPPVRRERGAKRWTVAHGPERRGFAPPKDESSEDEPHSAGPAPQDAAPPAEQRRPAACHREPRGCPASEHLDLGNREVLEKLERLDDAVFDAIAGNVTALEALKRLWPQLCQELAQPLLAESQEHYLRRAVSAWEEAANGDAPRNAQAAVQLLDVLATLFG
jgi:hypothetical protein